MLHCGYLKCMCLRNASVNELELTVAKLLSHLKLLNCWLKTMFVNIWVCLRTVINHILNHNLVNRVSLNVYNNRMLNIVDGNVWQFSYYLYDLFLEREDKLLLHIVKNRYVPVTYELSTALLWRKLKISENLMYPVNKLFKFLVQEYV